MIPDPGTQEAYEQGCICPLQRPILGGDGKPWFKLNVHCPLHGRGDWKDDKLVSELSS